MNSENPSGILDCSPWLQLDTRQETKESGNDEPLSKSVQEKHSGFRILDQATKGTPASTEVAKQLPSSSQSDSNDLVPKTQELSNSNYEGQQNQGEDEAYLFKMAFNL